MYSDDSGATLERSETPVAERFGRVDRFNHWLATDPVTGAVNVSFYDTRNDTHRRRYDDRHLSRRAPRTARSFAPSLRVTDVSSNEHDCNGVFPCPSINYGNQQGDYEGVAATAASSTPSGPTAGADQRAAPPAAAATGTLMEEVFTATVK